MISVYFFFWGGDLTPILKCGSEMYWFFMKESVVHAVIKFETKASHLNVNDRGIILSLKNDHEAFSSLH